jgi:hypothetical protein
MECRERARTAHLSLDPTSPARALTHAERRIRRVRAIGLPLTFSHDGPAPGSRSGHPADRLTAGVASVHHVEAVFRLGPSEVPHPWGVVFVFTMRPATPPR